MTDIGNLPSARMSPRIVNGVLKWYAGDTFEMQVEITLHDQDGELVEILPEHTIEFAFFNERKEPVKRFEFNSVENNTVTLVFDEGVTKLFPAGDYTYDVYFVGPIRRTLSNDSTVVVE